MDHLRERYYDTSVHAVWGEEECFTFPLWNLSGQIVGYQQYRPGADKDFKNNPHDGRYFNRIKEQKIAVWGLESWRFTDTLFITEGVFDASRLTWHGQSAIAVLTCTPSRHLIDWLWTVRMSRPTIAVCDGDAAGMKLARLADGHIVMPDGHDLGDVSEEYMKHFLGEHGNDR